jgi:hypothetical protein
VKWYKSKEEYLFKISKQLCSFGKFGYDMDIKRAWESITEEITPSASESLGYYELKQYRTRYDEECSKLLDKRKQLNHNGSRIQAK